MPYGRGVGVAGSMYISGTNYCIYPNEMPQAAVQLRLDRSGRATVMCGISDIGQGADSVLAYIVCEELGLELRDVRVVPAGWLVKTTSGKLSRGLNRRKFLEETRTAGLSAGPIEGPE